MRAICRGLITVLLVASLANLPAFAAANRTMGFVLAAQASQIDGIAAAGGTNVFPGDALTTNPDGRIRLQFGQNQIYIPASSAVTLGNGTDGVTAVLSAGTLEFTSPNGKEMAVRAEDVLIRPKTAQPTHAQITVLANDELKIATVTGPLELILDGKSYTLEPGRTYGARIVEEAANGQYENRSARNRRGLVIFLFAATAAVAAIIYLVQEMNESPAVP